MPESKRILFVINAASGKSNEDWQPMIEDYFKEKAHKILFYQLPSSFNKTYLERELNKIKCDSMVAVGGDGTFSTLVDFCAKQNLPLGILPTGSANGMAKELNIPLNIDEAMGIIDEHFVEEIDCISVNNQTCVHLSDIGLNAQLIKHFEAGKLRGKIGYAKVILKTLANRKRMTVKLKGSNNEIKRTAVMTVIANASKYGTGAVINPIGKLNDGLFEVVVVKHLTIRSLLKMLIKPGLFNPKDIEVYHCTELNINTDSMMHFQIDGEYLGRVKKVNAEILPGFLQIIVPNQPG